MVRCSVDSFINSRCFVMDNAMKRLALPTLAILTLWLTTVWADGLHKHDIRGVDGTLSGTLSVTGVTTITGIGDGGLTNYDLNVGDTTTPDYGMICFGDAVIGRTSYNVGNMDIDGSVVIRNMGTPATSNIEFVFTESGGDAIRFALAKSGIGNATYNPRSMLIAGPAVLDDEIVTVGYWQTNNSIFDNLACDTAGTGADLGVQNDLEVEGDIFTDSIKESTTAAGITLANDTVVTGTLTVNGDQTGALDHVFDEYEDIELLEVWRAGGELPFETGDLLNRDRLLRDAIIQLNTRILELEGENNG